MEQSRPTRSASTASPQTPEKGRTTVINDAKTEEARKMRAALDTQLGLAEELKPSSRSLDEFAKSSIPIEEQRKMLENLLLQRARVPNTLVAHMRVVRKFIFDNSRDHLCNISLSFSKLFLDTNK